ncbi:M43 family zinc metalloprotease [Winogradskyella bathintestinalis]|uniref:M43 family zinc metalloprotease n=1 Tax=Winogradskyella bathintestinalis TaxID=3035208 RepID=A0ABT7ZXR6_9FLAO|nr:M43 family zinc metalloprotease [Winogradskyella bathintestinalis]MDN3493769.1 M43 family zinc metalloprotease [Winogradskyella bathintestinalis]
MKFLKSTYLLLGACLFFTSFYAQQRCGFDDQRASQLQDPSFAAMSKAAEQRIQTAIENRSYSRMAGTVLTIPVVIHVLHLGETVGTGTNISDAQIQSSIDNLNDYYRGQIPSSPVDFEIEFVLAKRDPSCNATTGINRVDASGLPGYSSNGVNVNNSNGASYNDIVTLSSWPQTEYFNVWVVSELDGNNGGYGFQGYAYFYNEGFGGHGSVMMSTVFGYDPGNINGWGLNSNGDNSTVVHEVGHFFNLYHTFQGDGDGETCPADVTVGTNSDGCADTVPHKRETSSCPTINSCTLSPWVDNNTRNNIMSYYNCADRLTNDQKTRARAAMEETSIINSKGGIAPDPTYAAPVAACANNATSSNYSGITNVELNGVNYGSWTSASDGGNLDLTGDCKLYFEIDSDTSNTLNTTVLSVNIQQLGVWIDWNDDGDFEDEAELQYLENDINASISNEVSISINLPSTIPYGDYVRIRLITDLDYDEYGDVGPINSGCYTSLVYGQSEDYSIYIKPKTGGETYTYNNDWSPSNPVGISTSIDYIVIEAGAATISANTVCSTITVNPGAALTIDSGVSVTAVAVDLNSTSQMFSSLILDGSITGVVNYNKHTSIVGTNDLISAPVSGQLFPAFEIVNDNLAASGNIRAFAPYNTSVGEYQNYDLLTNVLTTIDAGKGYRAATTDDGNLTFTGVVRSDDVLDVPISDAAAGFAWNLIGNPYPSYLDFEVFFTTNASQLDANSEFQAIYGYDGNASNEWTVWNLATIADKTVTELIAPGQAFFVKSKATGGLVDFTTNMRRIGSSDDFIVGRNNNNNNNVALCELNLTSANNNASTKIYFIEGTTRGLDVGYDAGAYRGSASEFSIFSNLVEDNSGLDIAIQSLPFNDLSDVIIPLGINAPANEQLTISIADVSTVPSGTNVYLNDTYENTYTLLNTSDYIFTPTETLDGTERFNIQYATQTLSNDDNEFTNLQIYTTKTPRQVIVKGELNHATSANLYDIQGRLVLSSELNSSNRLNSINVSTLSTGIYIIELNSGDDRKRTEKLIIN